MVAARSLEHSGGHVQEDHTNMLLATVQRPFLKGLLPFLVEKEKASRDHEHICIIHMVHASDPETRGASVNGMLRELKGLV